MSTQEQDVPILCIQPEPTFWADVEFPVPGGTVAKIKVEFCHKDREEYQAFFQRNADKKDYESMPEIVASWKGLNVPYSAITLRQLFINYPSASAAFVAAYRDELFGAARKN